MSTVGWTSGQEERVDLFFAYAFASEKADQTSKKKKKVSNEQTAWYYQQSVYENHACFSVCNKVQKKIKGFDA